MVRLSSGCWRRPCRVSFLGRFLGGSSFRLAVGARPCRVSFLGRVMLISQTVSRLLRNKSLEKPCVFARVSLGQTTVLDKGFYDWCRNQKT